MAHELAIISTEETRIKFKGNNISNIGNFFRTCEVMLLVQPVFVTSNITKIIY